MKPGLKSIGLASLAALAISLALAFLPANQSRIATLNAERLHSALKETCQENGITYPISYNFVINEDALVPVTEEFERLGAFSGNVGVSRTGTLAISSSGLLLKAQLSGNEIKRIEASTPALLWTSLLPALLAVCMAVASRRILLALATGVVCGAVLQYSDGSLLSPLTGAFLGTYNVVRGVMFDDFHVEIFLFTFALIGMVNVASASGGMSGLARLLGRMARGARSSQAATAFLGLAIFFDDYSNTIVLGSSMRPLTDRARVSREKLSYIVDTTAAPVAALALVSTWIGYEVGLIGDVMKTLNVEGSPYGVFLSTLPFRFYCIMSLILLFVNIVSGREIGPMSEAQIRSLTTGQVLRPGSVPLSGAETPAALGRELALNAILPIVTVIFLVIAGMAANGAGIVTPEGFNAAAASVFDWNRFFTFEDNYIVLCQDGTWILMIAAFIGSALAVIMGVLYGKAPLFALIKAWIASWKVLALAFGVLILAWSIGDTNGNLGTGQYLVALLADSLPLWLLPLMIFIIGALISFATGSSWGTMAVLLPAAVPLAWHMGGMPLMIIGVGAVLDGSIFGDHCSPLSDTTIMSSISSGCDLMDHVRTQAPYALIAAAAAMITGYSIAILSIPWLSYIISSVVFILLFRFAGKKSVQTNIL